LPAVCCLLLFCSSPVYCTDNAAMIGDAAERRMQADDFAGWDLDIQPSLRLVWQAANTRWISVRCR